MNALGRLVPRSLGSRIALILIAGLLCAQLLTSTVWFDRRHRALMDTPNRIVAVRMGNAMNLLLRSSVNSPEQALAPLQTASFHAVVVPFADKPASQIGIDGNAIRIMRTIIEGEAGPIADLRVTRADLLGDDGRVDGMSTLLCAREPRGRYTIFVAIPRRPIWLRVDAFEGQHGAGAHCLTTIADYVLRIYLLRMVLLAAIALFAVRLAMQPLRRMITAAEALGDNIDRPPLPTRGPAEVKQAAEAFNTMQARLLKVMQERSHFLAAVSHDLRSPITRLRLRTETRLHDDLRDSFRRDLHEMESLIDATLSFIQDGTVMQDAVALDLFPILDDLAQLMREQGGKVALSGVRQATMRGYPQSLKRCFQNLIENALRYAGIAQVELEVDDHAVRVHVRDDGPGIPPDQLERMLEPFQRLEGSRSTATGGFGLGLSIAANIVKAHGGTLVLSNLPTGGLSVDITFPKSFENIPKTIVDVTASQGA